MVSESASGREQTPCQHKVAPQTKIATATASIPQPTIILDHIMVAKGVHGRYLRCSGLRLMHASPFSLQSPSDRSLPPSRAARGGTCRGSPMDAGCKIQLRIQSRRGDEVSGMATSIQRTRACNCAVFALNNLRKKERRKTKKTVLRLEHAFCCLQCRVPFQVGWRVVFPASKHPSPDNHRRKHPNHNRHPARRHAAPLPHAK